MNPQPPLDSNDRRILEILAPNKNLEYYPDANLDLLKSYMDYLKAQLPRGTLLAGREDVGVFSWESKYVWDEDQEFKEEHKEMKKTHASLDDIFQLVKIVGIEDEWERGILADVTRKPDAGRFHLPLHDLEGKRNTKKIDQIIEDYSGWMVNHYYI